MRASKHAGGTTFCLRCNLIKTAGLDVMGEIKVDPHIDNRWITCENHGRDGHPGAIRMT